ncbi:Voltage-gated calcium channel subunit alpha C-terminal [Trinorchestia longiramus]|nr:Voltage-gated calcium channel subunit alpha C-terminal [Trinorchestia longiramus]
MGLRRHVFWLISGLASDLELFPARSGTGLHWLAVPPTLLLTAASSHAESNGSPGGGDIRHTRSVPGSPRRSTTRQYAGIVGSAESLVERVLVEQGLGKYCDPDFVRNTSREIAEALQMTNEEMDRAAHNILSTSNQHLPENEVIPPSTEHLEDELYEDEDYEPRVPVMSGPRPVSMVRQPPPDPPL